MYERRPLGEIIERQVGGGTPLRSDATFWNGSIPWASVKDFAEGSLTLRSTAESITEAGLRASATNLVPAGVPLVCTRMAVGRAALPEFPVAINQDIRALFPRGNVHPRYLIRLLDFLKERAESRAVGSTVKGISSADYLAFDVPIAPPADQPPIAGILDVLDTEISQTAAVIDKLAHVKQGLLADLLTRGIDHNGQLRPPPERAPETYQNTPIGKIPNEWTLTPLQQCLSELPQNGIFKPANTIGRGSLMIGQNALNRDRTIDFSAARRAECTLTELGTWGLEDGDLLIARVFATPEGAGLPIFVTEPPEPAVFESNMMRLKPTDHLIRALYLFHWLRHPVARAAIVKNAQVSNQTSINQGGICKTPVALPPLQEQDAILGAIECHEARRRREEALLKILKQTKTGLMDDLLTGRVRVNPLLEAAQAVAE